VFADLPGTGASFGTLRGELGSAMIADVGSLADWIAARHWSNGRVGVTGVSYSADAAMLSLALRNHHITAAAPISYDFDPFEDLVRPGGILTSRCSPPSAPCCGSWTRLAARRVRQAPRPGESARSWG